MFAFDSIHRASQAPGRSHSGVEQDGHAMVFGVWCGLFEKGMLSRQVTHFQLTASWIRPQQPQVKGRGLSVVLNWAGFA